MKYVIALFLTFAALGSSFAYAEDNAITTVPFDFVVGNKFFHAGKYTISSSIGDAFQGTVLIRSTDGKTPGFFTPISGGNNLTQTAKLVFVREHDKYYLKEVVSAFENLQVRK
jgi:hypothetical protein